MDDGDEERRRGAGYFEAGSPEGHSVGDIQKVFGITQPGLQ